MNPLVSCILRYHLWINTILIRYVYVVYLDNWCVYVRAYVLCILRIHCSVTANQFIYIDFLYWMVCDIKTERENILSFKRPVAKICIVNLYIYFTYFTLQSFHTFYKCILGLYSKLKRDIIYFVLCTWSYILIECAMCTLIL